MIPADPLTFTVVIPCRNEEANVEAIAQAVIAELEPMGEPFDILFIDNQSADRTVEIVRGLCARDPRIRLIVNARNFGQMRSPTHALYTARGRAVIGMCADFQDPPTMIPQFVERWRAGVDIVLGVRQSESSSFLLSISRGIAYQFAKRFSDYPLIPNATGFGIYDRKVVQAIARINEPEPFFRGMLVETGFTIETIPYARPKRARGRSNNNVVALISFALSGLAGSSKSLLRVPFFAGVLVLLLAFASLIGAASSALLAAPVWPWLIAFAAETQIGVLFLFLGLIGDQVRLISERTRNTPLVFERERINFPADY